MTISGMTGFFRCEAARNEWSWAVEARSVNGRNLDVRFRGPPGFDGLERAAREAAQARFQRGQVGVNVQAKRSETGGEVRIDLAALNRYLAISQPFVAAGRALAPAMDGLLALRGVVEAGEESEDGEARAALEVAMAASIVEALDALKLERRAEGKALGYILAGFLDTIEAAVAASELEAAGQPVLIRDRFAQRLTELAGEAATPERILQEAAVQALKADVREELDRLANHIVSARGLLADTGACGRRLDFLTQEFMREANTLCAKSATPALTRLGLELKATIDQFREQVQNVE